MEIQKDISFVLKNDMQIGFIKSSLFVLTLYSLKSIKIRKKIIINIRDHCLHYSSIRFMVTLQGFFFPSSFHHFLFLLFLLLFLFLFFIFIFNFIYFFLSMTVRKSNPCPQQSPPGDQHHSPTPKKHGLFLNLSIF